MSEAVAERRALKDRVLEAALPHAAFDGWCRRTLANAAADAQIDAATAQRLFPQGGDSLLEWLDDWVDRHMLATLAAENLQDQPIRRRVARAVRARLELLASHREAIRRSVVARSLPQNVGPAGRSVWRTVDLIWEAVGMPGAKEEGWSWYTRRASLAAVLAATLLYWLEDSSEGQRDSWAFLERRIEDLMRIGRWRAQAEEILRIVPGLRAAARRQ